MHRSAMLVREDLDDIEDKSWKRKSYALAQNNALPIPMPRPIHPPPMPCPPSGVVIRPSRLRARMPRAGYRHPGSYQPTPAQNHHQRPQQQSLLPTLSETNALIPANLPLRKAPLPPSKLPTIESSPLENEDALPEHIPDTRDSFSKPSSIPVPILRFNHVSLPLAQPTNIPQPHSHIDIISPSESFPPQNSTSTRHDAVHPTLTTFTPHLQSQPITPPPPPIRYTPHLPPNSAPSPPSLSSLPQSLSHKSPPRQVPSQVSKITPPSLPSSGRRLIRKKIPVPLRPKEAPPAIPSFISRSSDSSSESQESLELISESRVLDNPAIPLNPTSQLPQGDANVTSGHVNPTSESEEKDISRSCGSPDTSYQIYLENTQPTESASDFTSYPVDSKSSVEIDSLYTDSFPKPQAAKVSDPHVGESHSDISPSSLEDCSVTPQTSIPESLTTQPASTTPTIIEDKTEPHRGSLALQSLPLTPSSQSRSSSLASIVCPRTPTSIRAAPSWQPLFLMTPLTKKSTSASNSETSLSPRSCSTPPRATTLPQECHHALPTPPSSPSQTRVDSVTSASSVLSFPQGHGQSIVCEDEEKVMFKQGMVDAEVDESSGPPPYNHHNHDMPSHHSHEPPHSPAHDPAPPTPDKAAIVGTSTLHKEAGLTPSIAPSETFKTYKSRFWILTVFSFICFLQTIVWGTFGPIAESAQAAFPTWDDSTIAAFPNWGPIIVVVFIFPMMWLSQRLGLQVAMVLCELFLTLGTMLRCFTSQETVFTVMCHVSSVLFAFAACFTLSLPAMVAATWFPPSERITATAVGTLMCQMGAAAMYLGALVVRYPSKSDIGNLTEEEREAIRGDIMVLMYIHFGIAVLMLLAVAIYFPAKPPTPPSASSTEERIDYFTAIKEMFKNLQMVIVLLVFAFSFGVPVVWIAVLNLSLKDIGINQDEAIGVAVTAVMCSSVTAFIAARITDKVYGHLKVTVITLLAISALFFLWFLLLTTQIIPPTLGQVYAAVAGGLGFEYATVPLLVELAVEIGFPIPESVTGATLTFVFNLVSLVFLGLFQIPNEGHLWVSCVLFACVSLSILPLLFVKETHKRSDTDRQFM